jgi:hypothetical protein
MWLSLFLLLLFSCASTLVVTPFGGVRAFIFLLIKSVGLLFLCLLNVPLQLHQLIGQIGNSSFLCQCLWAREASG